MLASITARQFQEWRAYADLEPFDEERADYRAASIVQAVRNAFRGKRPPVKLSDCVLPFEPKEVEAPDPAKAREQILQTMKALMAIHNVPKPGTTPTSNQGAPAPPAAPDEQGGSR